MKRILLLLAAALVLLPLSAPAQGGNTNLTGSHIPDTQPVPVKVMAGAINVSAASTTALTTSISTASTSGSVGVGARSVEFIFSDDFVGTVKGVAYTGANDTSQRFPALGEHTYPAIAYTRTAGSVRIVEVR